LLRADSHKFPETIGVELTCLVELIYEICDSVIGLERGELPNISMVAVEAAFLQSSHHTPSTAWLVFHKTIHSDDCREWH